MLYDGDCFNISLKSLENGKDLYTRPVSFYNSSCAVRELFKDYPVDVYFGCINSETVDGRPKGLDDIFIAKPGEEPELVTDLLQLSRPGFYFTKLNITNATNKLAKLFNFEVNSLYRTHADVIKNRQFVYRGTGYVWDDGKQELTVVVPAEAKLYFRVGDDYYKYVKIPNKYAQLEQQYHRRNITTITGDHGKKLLTHVAKYEAFCNVPEQLMLFLPDCHVNHSALPAKEKAQRMTAIYGQKCIEQYERLSRHGLLQKMFLEYLLLKTEWYSKASNLTWKIQAIPYSTQLKLVLKPSKRHIAETEFGLLPTVLTQGLKICKDRKSVFVSLKLLPTPTGMIPGDVNMEKLDARRERVKKESGNGNRFGVTLNELCKKGLLPTPRVGGQENYETRAKRKGHAIAMSYLESNLQFQTGTSSQLNALFVAEMMGFPPDWTVLPFKNGAGKVSRLMATQ